MKKNQRIGILSLAVVLAIALFQACSEKDKGIPVVQTGEVSRVDSNVCVTAVILNNPGDIVEYGFQWGVDPEATYAKQIVCGSVPVNNIFRGTISKEDFAVGNTYFRVRAFVRTPLNTYYGREVKFIPDYFAGPRIDYFTPTEAEWGDTITIFGKNFLIRPDLTTIYFGNFKADILELNDSVAVVYVPNTLNLIHSRIKIVNNGISVESDTDFGISQAEIFSYKPDTVSPYGYVRIQGRNFGHNKNFAELRVEGKWQVISSINDTSIVFMFPNINTLNPVVSLKILGRDAVNHAVLVNPGPVIYSVSPLLIWPTDVLTIRGRAFGTTSYNIMITVDGVGAHISHYSDTVIKAVILNTTNSGSKTIVLKKPGSFYVTREDAFTLVIPKIVDVQPREFSRLDTITITGIDFKESLSRNQVLLRDVVMYNVIESTENKIRFVIPDSYNFTGYVSLKLCIDRKPVAVGPMISLIP